MACFISFPTFPRLFYPSVIHQLAAVDNWERRRAAQYHCEVQPTDAKIRGKAQKSIFLRHLIHNIDYTSIHPSTFLHLLWDQVTGAAV